VIRVDRGQWRAEVWWCPGRLLDCMHPYQIIAVAHVGHCYWQGRNERSKGGAIPQGPSQYGGAKSLRGTPNGRRDPRKVPTMSQVLPSIQYICFRQTSVMGASNLLLAQAPTSHVAPLVTGYTLFVKPQYDVILTFANQRFGEVRWHNMHIILHALSLVVVVQCITITQCFLGVKTTP